MVDTNFSLSSYHVPSHATSGLYITPGNVLHGRQSLTNLPATYTSVGSASYFFADHRYLYSKIIYFRFCLQGK